MEILDRVPFKLNVQCFVSRVITLLYILYMFSAYINNLFILEKLVGLLQITNTFEHTN